MLSPQPQSYRYFLSLTAAEVDRLLSLLTKYIPEEEDDLDADAEGEDAFDAPCDGFVAEFSAFKAHMKKARIFMR